MLHGSVVEEMHVTAIVYERQLEIMNESPVLYDSLKVGEGYVGKCHTAQITSWGEIGKSNFKRTKSWSDVGIQYIITYKSRFEICMNRHTVAQIM